MLGNLEEVVNIGIPFRSAAIVDVGKPSDDTDDLALALLVILLLSDKLPDIRLDVSLVKQIICESSDGLGITTTLVHFFVGGRFTSTIVPVVDRGVALDLETLCKSLLGSCINLTQLDLALELSSCLVPLRLESLAVTTPWGVELDKPNVF